jgi:lysine-specific demethylase 8
MALRRIPRISMPDPDTFIRDYVWKLQPVIVTDLFAGDEIGGITTLAAANAAFGRLRLRVEAEYTSAAASNGRAATEVMTLDEYWDFAHANPSTPIMCTEQEIPARVMALFSLPDICRARDLGEEEVLSLPRRYGDHDLFANVFIGNQGNKTHLHYDADHRHVLLYQVFGRKEVVLFPPRSGGLLRLLTSGPAMSDVSLEDMSATQRAELVDQADGYIDTLYPGEAIYMPMLIWHYLEYTDDAMSFNVRFGRRKYGRFFSVDHFHRDYYIQNFAAKLGDPAACETVYRAPIARAIDEYLAPAANMREKVEQVRALFKELCRVVCPEAGVETYCPSDREDGEVDRILQELQGTMRYAPPHVHASVRPLGSITAAQRSQIEREVASRGYPAGMFARILDNRVGKTDLHLLTRAEAAQMMSYLRSPSSYW